MALLYPGRLPIGALLDHDMPAAPATASPAATLPPPAPIWFSTAATDTLELNENGRVTAWQAVGQPARLTALNHNREGTVWDRAAKALQFQGRTHGGLGADAILPHGNCFSLGMIYTPLPKGHTMTLCSLQAVDSEDYLFLSAWNGIIRFALRENEANFSQTEPKTTTLLVLSSNGTQVKLAVNRGPCSAIDFAIPDLPHDLFIGCRGSARSLVNKLGSFDLTDVMIWPDQDVLSGQHAQAPESALAHWQERLRHGA